MSNHSEKIIMDTLYIKWVQRSLNRLIGAGLKVNGNSDDWNYRKELQGFKQINNIKEPGLASYQIGEKCQSEIIKQNHRDLEYQVWVCKILPNAPANPQFGDKIPDSVIRDFQRKENLKVDGWIGYKTELRLIQIAKQEPPEAKDEGGSPDPWIIWWNNLTASQRYGVMIERASKEYESGAYNPRLKCLAKKLNRFRPDGFPENFFFFSRQNIVDLKDTNDPILYKEMQKGLYRNRIEMSNEVNRHLMTKYMQQTISFLGGGNSYPDNGRWRAGSKVQYEGVYRSFLFNIIEIERTIEDGIGTFGHWWGRVGERPTLYLARNIFVLLSKEHSNIYQCYRDIMPPRYTDGLTFPY